MACVGESPEIYSRIALRFMTVPTKSSRIPCEHLFYFVVRVYAFRGLIFCNEVGGLYDPKNFYWGTRGKLRGIAPKINVLKSLKFQDIFLMRRFVQKLHDADTDRRS
jgi:hypothetical protein